MFQYVLQQRNSNIFVCVLQSLVIDGWRANEHRNSLAQNAHFYETVTTCIECILKFIVFLLLYGTWYLSSDTVDTKYLVSTKWGIFNLWRSDRILLKFDVLKDIVSQSTSFKSDRIQWHWRELGGGEILENA